MQASCGRVVRDGLGLDEVGRRLWESERRPGRVRRGRRRECNRTLNLIFDTTKDAKKDFWQAVSEQK